MQKILAYIRGAISSVLQFDKKAMICQLGRIKVIKQNAEIEIGDRTILWPNIKLSCCGKPPIMARLKIGKRCSIGDRTEIHCGNAVTIGDDVIIAWDCNILDRDYHSADGSTEQIEPVFIGNRVWIGCHSIILKGVTIGQDSVVAAGSVVTKNVPEKTLVAGNPAKIVKKVKGWKPPN